jgi:hypothetical protein
VYPPSEATASRAGLSSLRRYHTLGNPVKDHALAQRFDHMEAVQSLGNANGQALRFGDPTHTVPGDITRHPPPPRKALIDQGGLFCGWSYT